MRSTIPLLVALLLAGSAFAQQAATPEALASPQELAAVEAAFDRQTDGMTRELDARIERMTSQMTAHWLDASLGTTSLAAAAEDRRVGSAPARVAPRVADAEPSRMACGMAAEGVYECRLAAAGSLR